MVTCALSIIAVKIEMEQMLAPEAVEKAKKELVRINEDLFRQSSLKFPLPKEESTEKPVLYVFRHGQSVDNEDFVFSGWRDSYLSETGINQARLLGERMGGKKIDLGIHSRLSRSLETLNIVLSYLPDQKSIRREMDDRIIERSYGILQGQSKVESFLTDRSLYEKYHRAYDFPAKDGESLKMVEERILPFCSELKQRMKKETINVAISAHSNSMRVLRRYFENLTIEEMSQLENPLAQDYCSYVID